MREHALQLCFDRILEAPEVSCRDGERMGGCLGWGERCDCTGHDRMFWGGGEMVCTSAAVEVPYTGICQSSFNSALTMDTFCCI